MGENLVPAKSSGRFSPDAPLAILLRVGQIGRVLIVRGLASPPRSQLPMDGRMNDPRNLPIFILWILSEVDSVGSELRCAGTRCEMGR